uniref:Uncharacterized protein n=1 Tax=Setaria italica TaxID=4555 RepID=K3YDH6_SETIT
MPSFSSSATPPFAPARRSIARPCSSLPARASPAPARPYRWSAAPARLCLPRQPCSLRLPKPHRAYRRKQAAHAGGGSELNINIWPFSRSRSADGGSGSSKPRPPAWKVSNAPCSRSNSRGEAGPPWWWAASPGRAAAGMPVGWSSPVWQIRRPVAKPAPAPLASELAFADRRAPPPQTYKDSKLVGAAGGGRKPGMGGDVQGLNLSVNSCIGYRHQVSCRRADVGAARGPSGGGLFGINERRPCSPLLAPLAPPAGAPSAPAAGAREAQAQVK